MIGSSMAHGLVEQRRRAVARVALYGSLVLVAAVTFVARSYLRLPPASIAESRWLDVDWTQSVAVRLLQQLIRIDTSEETGDPYAAMLFLSTPLEAAGLDVHIERVGPHEANLWPSCAAATRARWCCSATSTSRGSAR